MFRKTHLILILLPGLFSCQRNEVRDVIIIHPGADNTSTINLILNDTFTVKGAAIVFFKPTFEESILLMQSANQTGFGSEMSDLELNYTRVMNQLQHSDILSFMTTARYISVESSNGLIVHDRLTDTSLSGIILSAPNRQTKILNSLHTQSEYNKEIKSYFF